MTALLNSRRLGQLLAGIAGVVAAIAVLSLGVASAHYDVHCNSQTPSSVCYGDEHDNLLDGAVAEEYHGRAGKDKIYSYTFSDDIDGGDGQDYAEGDSNDDSIYGGNGDDAYDCEPDPNATNWCGLEGQADDDHLYGEGDDDVLEGGGGKDHAYGGTGNDWMWVCNDNGPQNAVDGNAGSNICYVNPTDTWVHCERHLCG